MLRWCSGPSHLLASALLGTGKGAVPLPPRRPHLPSDSSTSAPFPGLPHPGLRVYSKTSSPEHVQLGGLPNGSRLLVRRSRFLCKPRTAVWSWEAGEGPLPSLPPSLPCSPLGPAGARGIRLLTSASSSQATSPLSTVLPLGPPSRGSMPRYLPGLATAEPLWPLQVKGHFSQGSQCWEAT